MTRRRRPWESGARALQEEGNYRSQVPDPGQELGTFEDPEGRWKGREAEGKRLPQSKFPAMGSGHPTEDLTNHSVYLYVCTQCVPTVCVSGHRVFELHRKVMKSHSGVSSSEEE